MKKFRVTVDITLSKDYEIEAETKREAEEIAREKGLAETNFTWCHVIDSEVYNGYTEEITEEN